MRTDVRFSHEYVTPMAESLFRAGLGKDAKVTEPESVFAFRDHLTFLDLVMPEAHVKHGPARSRPTTLATVQEAFTKRQGIKLYGEVHRDGKLVGSEAICHNKVIEELALPGQLVAGTDSHTCMAGALGCFAFGVGSTDMANAWYTRDVRVAVPETVRFVLHGALRPGVCAKDVMLHILSQPFFEERRGHRQGARVRGRRRRARCRSTSARRSPTWPSRPAASPASSRPTRSSSTTSSSSAGSTRTTCARASCRPIAGAEYLATFDIDLGAIEPMVATPGDPRNGIPLAKLARRAAAT